MIPLHSKGLKQFVPLCHVTYCMNLNRNTLRVTFLWSGFFFTLPVSVSNINVLKSPVALLPSLPLPISWSGVPGNFANLSSVPSLRYHLTHSLHPCSSTPQMQVFMRAVRSRSSPTNPLLSLSDNGTFTECFRLPSVRILMPSIDWGRRMWSI
jgi:hypothetical protein